MPYLCPKLSNSTPTKCLGIYVKTSFLSNRIRITASIGMMISAVVNLDNAKDRSAAGWGMGRDGDSTPCRQGFVRFMPLAVRRRQYTTVVRLCAARAPLPIIQTSTFLNNSSSQKCSFVLALNETASVCANYEKVLWVL